LKKYEVVELSTAYRILSKKYKKKEREIQSLSFSWGDAPNYIIKGFQPNSFYKIKANVTPVF
jgi:hypothetical protein